MSSEVDHWQRNQTVLVELWAEIIGQTGWITRFNKGQDQEGYQCDWPSWSTLLISWLSWNLFQSEGTKYLALGIEYRVDLVVNRTVTITGCCWAVADAIVSDWIVVDAIVGSKSLSRSCSLSSVVCCWPFAGKLFPEGWERDMNMHVALFRRL